MREFTTPLLVGPSGHRNATELLMLSNHDVHPRELFLQGRENMTLDLGTVKERYIVAHGHFVAEIRIRRRYCERIVVGLHCQLLECGLPLKVLD